MGSVNFFNIQQIMQDYGCDIFIETGLGQGSSLRHIQNFPFRCIISTEILDFQARKVFESFKDDDRVHVLVGNSYELLQKILEKNFSDHNILFWLDAHYPGGDLGINDYDYEQDIDKRLPLENELEVIHHYRKDKKDVILIDDLRIYEHGPYESKNLDEVGLGHIAKYDSKFLDKYSEKYNIEKFYQDTGFIKLTPKAQSE